MSSPGDVLAAIPPSVREALVACSKARGLVVRWKEDRDEVPQLVLCDGAFEGESQYECRAYLTGLASVVGREEGSVRVATLGALGELAKRAVPALIDLAERARHDASQKCNQARAAQLLADALKYEAEAEAVRGVAESVALAWSEALQAANGEDGGGDRSARLKRLRKALGWTQAELAGRARLQGPYCIAKIETRRNKVGSYRLISALAGAFGVRDGLMNEYLNGDVTLPGLLRVRGSACVQIRPDHCPATIIQQTAARPKELA